MRNRPMLTAMLLGLWLAVPPAAYSAEQQKQPNPEGDVIEGGPGGDEIRGGRGDDVLRGGPGDDLIQGGPGKDRIEGGPGNDQLEGYVPRGEKGYEDRDSDSE
ncbi:MAG: hypothetical protein WCH75_24705 [Candidatus Binatia bacterium]